MSTENRRTIEDSLINAFIEHEVPLWDPDGHAGEAKYHSGTRDDREEWDLQAFQYFYGVQEEKAQNNAKYGSITFDNFLKIYRPDDNFVESFRAPEPPIEGPAVMWHDIFNRDSGLMKESALKGLKRMLASQMASRDNG